MIVIDSSPAINLNAALSDLTVLCDLYGPVIVPFELFQELEAGADKDSTAEQLRTVPGIIVRQQPIEIPALLGKILDLGEAAVIQTALMEAVPTVVLDDLKARRIARLAGLEVTGSLGVLVQAKQVGQLRSVGDALKLLKARGTWLHPDLVKKTLQMAGESFE